MTITLELGTPFSDHMILQQGRANRIWGWDRPEQALRVTVSGPNGELTCSARADNTGAFECHLPALTAGGPYTLSIEGSSLKVLRDVLVGEVWLASGQSNMEWSVAQSADAESTIASATCERIRCLRMPRTPAREPQKTSDVRWMRVTPDSVAQVSAVAYSFARELERELDVPIGIIDASYGGTRVEAWTSREALAKVLDLDAELRRFYPPEAEYARIASEYNQRLLTWEREKLPDDPGNRGLEQGFAQRDFDDAGWRPMVLPTNWQAAGMRFNGVVWFRREVELPAAWANTELSLSLGAIDDFDHTYVNGVLVGAHPKGTPQAFQIQRRYQVPSTLLRPGRNVIAVRVFDHFGEGGLLGPGQAMYLANATGERISLAGEWRAGVEHEIPLVPGTVFETYPIPPEPMSPQNAPAGLFNGMLAPLIPYGLAGTLFYQGESNVEEHESYARRFRAFVRDVRTRFEQGQLPFLFVQLAAFQATPGWPLLREAQAEIASEPMTGMVCTLDIGDRHDIHPREKREVGRRLALLALHDCYARSDLVPCGPRLRRATLRGSEAHVEFEFAAGLNACDGAPVRGFELAGKNGLFVAAEARIVGASVVVSCARVAEPVAVRYAFRDFPEVNLVNAAGLPAFPFRTDCF